MSRWTTTNKAERGSLTEAEVHLNFQDLTLLLAVLTPRRLV